MIFLYLSLAPGLTAPRPSLHDCPLLFPGIRVAQQSTTVHQETAPCPALLHRHHVTLCLTRLPRCLSGPQRSSSTTPSTCSLPQWAVITGTSAAHRVPQTHHPVHHRLESPGGAAHSAPARTACARSLFPSLLHLCPHAITPAHNSLNSHQRHTKGSCCSHCYKASHWLRTVTAASESVLFFQCLEVKCRLKQSGLKATDQTETHCLTHALNSTHHHLY